MASAVDEPPPLAEGWLYKRSHVLRVWRRRKAVLKPGQFRLYQSPKGGSAPLLRATFTLSEECRVERAADAHRRLHAFLLVGPRIRAYLAADTAAEMERWVLLLGSCCRKEMAELPPAATLSVARATPASPVIALWPRAELAGELPPQPALSEAFDADRDLSSDEMATRGLLDRSQYEELLRWPQLLSLQHHF